MGIIACLRTLFMDIASPHKSHTDSLIHPYRGPSPCNFPYSMLHWTPAVYSNFSCICSDVNIMLYRSPPPPPSSSLFPTTCLLRDRRSPLETQPKVHSWISVHNEREDVKMFEWFIYNFLRNESVSGEHYQSIMFYSRPGWFCWLQAEWDQF